MPPNFTDYEASSSYTTELSSTWVPLLTSIAADVAFFDGATSSLAQQLAAAKAVANDYEARLVALEAALGDANAIATAVVSAIGGVELRVVTGALALEAEFAYLSALWLAHGGAKRVASSVILRAFLGVLAGFAALPLSPPMGISYRY